MSEINAPTGSPLEGRATNGDDGKITAAKHEAAHLTENVQSEASDLTDAVKSETESVTRDAKREIHDLYEEARHELTDQAAQQQERVAGGLRSISTELGTMVEHSPQSGVASELVTRVSEHTDTMANWLENRTPGGVLDEVKHFARRKPGTFIAAAAIAGLVAGRLTRALASDNSSDSRPQGSGTRSVTPPVGSATNPSVAPASAAVPASEGGMNDARRSIHSTEGVSGAAPRETPIDPTRMREDLR